MREGATTREQADRFLGVQRHGLSHWLDSRIESAHHSGQPAHAAPSRPPAHATRSMLRCRVFGGSYHDGRLSLPWAQMEPALAAAFMLLELAAQKVATSEIVEQLHLEPLLGARRPASRG